VNQKLEHMLKIHELSKRDLPRRITHILESLLNQGREYEVYEIVRYISKLLKKIKKLEEEVKLYRELLRIPPEEREYEYLVIPFHVLDTLPG